MTLLEVKKKILTLIEEYSSTGDVTNDPDILAKLDGVIDTMQKELATIKRIKAKHTFTYVDTKEFDLPSDFYQVDQIKDYKYEILGGKIIFEGDFEEDDEIDMYYYKYPATITDATADSHDLEIGMDCINAMLYGVASDVLKADVSANFSVYANRYQELKSQLRMSDTSPMVNVDFSDDYKE